MNTFGGTFDFDNFVGYDEGNNQQQETTRPSQYSPPGGGGFDPSTLLGLQYSPTYNSTSNHHTALLPPPALHQPQHQHSSRGSSSRNSLHQTVHQQLQSAYQSAMSSPGSSRKPQTTLLQKQKQQQHYGRGFVPLDHSISLHVSMDQQKATSLQVADIEKHLLASYSPSRLFPEPSASSSSIAEPARKVDPDTWLQTLSIKCTDVSLEPLTGGQLVHRVRTKTDYVVTRYLPCVEFLVSCQQELRAGLQLASQRKYHRTTGLTPRQFYLRYLHPLPQKFFQHNQTLMEQDVLVEAVGEIKKLTEDCQRVEQQGCEVMKNTFLGGMKDGESWGLRKWLSKHGSALHICNDLECILRSCQDLDRNLESTKKLGERLRPLAQQALKRLQTDVPSSYQEVSTAHPYLPFFHRLESALKGMANFDPDDDDVICIDDEEELEQAKQQAVQKSNTKRAAEVVLHQPFEPPVKKNKQTHDYLADLKPPEFDDQNDDGVLPDSVLDALIGGPGDWECPRCTMLNEAGIRRCCMCDQLKDGVDSDDDEGTGYPSYEDVAAAMGAIWDTTKSSGTSGSGTDWSISAGGNADAMSALQMAATLDKIANEYGENRNYPHHHNSAADFWDTRSNFSGLVRLLATLLRDQDVDYFVDLPNDMELVKKGKPMFSAMVKHPLCFRDIVKALLGDGKLPSVPSLKTWNMWKGVHLLQAMDLVLVNHLAYQGKVRTKERSDTNRLRRTLWDPIHSTVASFTSNDEEKRRLTPPRRGETSGFVIYK